MFPCLHYQCCQYCHWSEEAKNQVKTEQPINEGEQENIYMQLWWLQKKLCKIITFEGKLHFVLFMSLTFNSFSYILLCRQNFCNIHTNKILLLCRHILELIQGRSHMCAAGQAVAGGLQDQMSSPDTRWNIFVFEKKNTVCLLIGVMEVSANNLLVFWARDLKFGIFY